ncbi:hypothetical protein D9M72_474900 [compost metagenome]
MPGPGRRRDGQREARAVDLDESVPGGGHHGRHGEIGSAERHDQRKLTAPQTQRKKQRREADGRNNEGVEKQEGPQEQRSSPAGLHQCHRRGCHGKADHGREVPDERRPEDRDPGPGGGDHESEGQVCEDPAVEPDGGNHVRRRANERGYEPCQRCVLHGKVVHRQA